MRLTLRRAVLISLVIGAVASTPLLAATLAQMNLGDLCERADRIYRGTVVQTETGMVKAGGGEIPTITYTIRVDQAFKGDFETVKGEQMVTLTTLGKIPPVQVGGMTRFSALPEVPTLSIGGDYLLFTTPPSGGNLASPVGLGQGTFDIKDKDGMEMAVNQFQNIGLFRDMDVTGIAREGAVRYDRLADVVRTTLTVQEGGIR
jgi:hypothetical protein